MLDAGVRTSVPRSAAAVVALLTEGGIAAHDTFVRYQEQWGGLCFDADHGWTLGLFAMGYPHAEVRDGKWYVECAEHDSSPFCFMLCEDGRIYADEHPIAETVVSWLESCAVLAEMVGERDTWRWLRADLPAPDGVPAQLGVSPISVASDAFCRWYSRGDLRVRVFGQWGRGPGASLLWAWAPNDAELVGVADILQAQETEWDITDWGAEAPWVLEDDSDELDHLLPVEHIEASDAQVLVLEQRFAHKMNTLAAAGTVTPLARARELVMLGSSLGDAGCVALAVRRLSEAQSQFELCCGPDAAPALLVEWGGALRLAADMGTGGEMYARRAVEVLQMAVDKVPSDLGYRIKMGVALTRQAELRSDLGAADELYGRAYAHFQAAWDAGFEEQEMWADWQAALLSHAARRIGGEGPAVLVGQAVLCRTMRELSSKEPY